MPRLIIILIFIIFSLKEILEYAQVFLTWKNYFRLYHIKRVLYPGKIPILLNVFLLPSNLWCHSKSCSEYKCPNNMPQSYYQSTSTMLPFQFQLERTVQELHEFSICLPTFAFEFESSLDSSSFYFVNDSRSS